MALPSLLTSPQFLLFVHLLRTNPREALSYLDYAWLLLNISGDPHYKNLDALEGILHWDGKRGALVKAMTAAGFLKKRGATGYTLADWEDHLYDWGKKRLARAREAEQRAADERRRTAPKVRPTDPDPRSSPKEGKIIPIDHDQGRGKDRNRRETAKPEGGSPSKNPKEAAQGLARALGAALTLPGSPGSHQKAPSPTQPIGSYSARDCAHAAAALDKDLPPQQAIAMWITRAAEVSQYTGGLSYFQDLLSTIANSQIPGNPKGVGTIRHPGRWLNAKTHEYIQRKATA